MENYLKGIDEIRLQNTRALMSENNLTRTQLSEKTGISYVLLGHYIGKNPNKKIGDETAEKIEKAFNKPKHWLDNDHYGISTINAIKETNYAQVDDGELAEDEELIAINNVIFCCGDGNNADFDFNDIVGYRKFPSSFFKDKGIKPKNFKLVCAMNDSQKPYIKEKDIVGIDISDREIRDGEMYAILLDGERMFKIIFREAGNAFRLHCYNPAYPDKLVSAENHQSLVIIGKEVYRAG